MWREWKSFGNGARSDGLKLSHWTKAGADPEAGKHASAFLIARVNVDPLGRISFCKI